MVRLLLATPAAVLSGALRPLCRRKGESRVDAARALGRIVCACGDGPVADTVAVVLRSLLDGVDVAQASGMDGLLPRVNRRWPRHHPKPT